MWGREMKSDLVNLIVLACGLLTHPTYLQPFVPFVTLALSSSLAHAVFVRTFAGHARPQIVL